VTLIRASLVEFKNADQCSTLFTKEWKSVCRNWANYLTDMAVIMEEEQDEHVLADMTVLQKQGNVCKTVLNKVSQKGMTDTETLSCFEQQLQYLSMDPAAPIPFPNHFMKSMNQQIIEDAWPAEKFWDMLGRDRIITLSITDVAVQEFQMNTFLGEDHALGPGQKRCRLHRGVVLALHYVPDQE